MRNKISFKSVLIFFLFISFKVCPEYEEFAGEFFFGRQPNPRAEAMGRSNAVFAGDLYSSLYNPALIGETTDWSIAISRATPYYLLDNAVISYLGLAHKFNSFIAAGITRFHFNDGLEITLRDAVGDSISTYKPYISNYTLTLSFQLIKDLFLGLNTNLFLYKWSNKLSKALYLDVGFLKSFIVYREEKLKHKIIIGGSIKNATYSGIPFYVYSPGYGQRDTLTFQEDLPVIGLAGVAYEFSLENDSFPEGLRAIELMLSAEYQKVLNYNYRRAIHFGTEITLFEILSLRGGYYREIVDDYGYSSNKDKISDLTYGLGVAIPINKLIGSGRKINMRIDFVRLPQVRYTNEIFFDFKDFYSIGVQMSLTF
ncbi:hypothetical protein KAW48_04080 [candidate division WOR-3 bacterium]|nr:hypothetical protein [candidate division WOR-3 bacterium]